jgi:hypothetical protein
MEITVCKMWAGNLKFITKGQIYLITAVIMNTQLGI